MHAASLMSSETLDRTSPELWPESLPGISGYGSQNPGTPEKKLQPWDRPLDGEDLALMQKYGSLSKEELAVQIKKLIDFAYYLGMKESKEMTHGRFLNILKME